MKKVVFFILLISCVKPSLNIPKIKGFRLRFGPVESGGE